MIFAAMRKKPYCLVDQWYPGGHLNIKMSSYQYRDSHVKDKTVSSTVLFLTWESPYLVKTVFILRWGPGPPSYAHRPAACPIKWRCWVALLVWFLTIHLYVKTQIAKLMGPTWDPPGVLPAPGGSHVGPINFAIREYNHIGEFKLAFRTLTTTEWLTLVNAKPCIAGFASPFNCDFRFVNL